MINENSIRKEIITLVEVWLKAGMAKQTYHHKDGYSTGEAIYEHFIEFFKGYVSKDGQPLCGVPSKRLLLGILKDEFKVASIRKDTKEKIKQLVYFIKL